MSVVLKNAVAVIGIGCRFPGHVRNLEELWKVLKEGRDVVGSLPADRFDVARYWHPDEAAPGKTYAPRAGIACDVRRFDARFWGFSEKEAETLDPQQRMALEMTWEAFEDAGIPPSTVAGTNTAAYIGSASADMGMLHSDDLQTSNAYTMTGTQLSIISNRISYCFDLHGPSLTVDTACSSSLVAIDAACRAVSEGKVPMAVAGGVNVLLAPMGFVGFAKAHMLSKTGTCRVFDADGDGYVRSEGGAIILLKTLEQAQADGDPIYAVIRATSVNSDGRTAGIALPNVKAQTALLQTMYGEGGMDPRCVAYVEAHGTGTKAGDPIETTAIGTVLGHGEGEAALPVGSIKANVGHLETASGMAGLAKVLNVLQKGTIPPNIHFDHPNPAIHFDKLGIRVPTAMEPLPKTEGKPLVGLNSFGFGGTNAHLVFEQYEAPAAEFSVPQDRLLPLLLTAKSKDSLIGLVKALLPRLETADDATFNRTASALFHQREHLAHRLYAEGTSAAALAAELQKYVQNGEVPEKASFACGRDAAGCVKTAFIYSGNGSQWVGMGRELYKADPEFKASVDRTDRCFKAIAGWSPAAYLQQDDKAWDLNDASVVQPLLFTVEAAMTDSLRAAGITADLYMGHSAGEAAAAWASGALTLEDAVTVIWHRSRQQQTLAGTGAMAVARLEAKKFEELLSAYPTVSVAARNAEGDYTVGGTTEGIAAFVAAVKASGGKAQQLALNIAFHNPVMEVLKPAFLQAVEGIHPRKTERFCSTVTGQLETTLDAAYWWKNLRQTVEFQAGTEALVAAGVRRFAEIGPHSILLGYVKHILKARRADGETTGLMRRGDAPERFKANRLQLVADGWPVKGLWPIVGRDRTLPRYVWDAKLFWPKPTADSAALYAPQSVNPLLGWPVGNAQMTWVNDLDAERLPWLAGHKVGDTVLYPAAGFLETAAAAARSFVPREKAFSVKNLAIFKPLALTNGSFYKLRTRVDADGRLTVESRPTATNAEWLQHVAARVVPADWTPGRRRFDEVALGESLSTEAFYAGLRKIDLNYEGAFRAVKRVWVHEKEIIARLEMPIAVDQSQLVLAPPLVDGALQSVFAALALKADGTSAYLPVWVESFTAQRGGAAAWSVVTIRRANERSVAADIRLFDAAGVQLAALTGVRFIRTAKALSATAPLFYREAWRTAVPELPFDTGVTALKAAVSRVCTEWSGNLTEGDEAEPLVLMTLAAFAYEAVERFDEPVPSDLLFSSESFVVNEGWAAFLAGLLADAGLAEEADGLYRVEKKTVPAAAVLLRTLSAKYPAYWEEWSAVNMVGSRVRDLLQGDADFEELHLTAAGKAQVCRPICDEAAAAAVARFTAHLTHNTPNAHWRIGVITDTDFSAVKRLKAECGLNVHWTVLTTEAKALERARLAFEKTERVSAEALKAEKAAEGFDLVLALKSVSCAKNPTEFLEEAAARVTAGGFFAGIDEAPNPLRSFIDGTQNDWWVEDHGVFYPPLMDAAGWETALTTAGFAQQQILTPQEVTPKLLVLAKKAAAEEKPTADAVPALCFAADAGDAAQKLTALWQKRGIVVKEPGESGINRTVSLWTTETAEAPEEALKTAQALATTGRPQEWIVVTGARSSLSSMGLLGLTRVVKNECPTLSVHWLALDDMLPETLAAAAELIGAKTLSFDEAAVRSGRIWQAAVETEPMTADGTGNPVTLAFDIPGKLERLYWKRTAKKSLGAREIRVEVKAAGLNFRDVMWAMGMLPEEALENGFSGPTMGLEAAGVVTEVGSAVTRFVPGESVIAFAPACLSSEIVTTEDAVAKKPKTLSFAEAASVPVAFFTAWYSLVYLGRARRGESVLVHGAAGGVGLAALQIAALLGLKVYATAGSDAKRAFVRSLGVEHVYDSRSLAFADEIRRDTDGRGVDLVLNSLAGAGAEASLALLAPFGRFLELGKRDFYADNPMFLKPFGRNLSYFGIDVDQLLTANPELAHGLFEDVIGAFGAGSLRALPITVFPQTKAADAFQIMQASGHMGKLVISMTNETLNVREAPLPSELTLKSNGLYVVTGGLGGLGKAVVRLLVRRGARYLALISRKGAVTDEQKAFVQELQAAGVTVVTPALNVADAHFAADLGAALKDLPSVNGVIHAAGIIEDALLPQQTPEALKRVWDVKVKGALALDALSRTGKWDLDFFCAFSSATVLIGNPGQANYVAANTALEALIARRRAAGLPASLIGWGPVGDVGMLANLPKVKAQLEMSLGASSLTSGDVTKALEKMLLSDAAVCHYFGVDWKRLLNMPILKDARFEALREGAGSDTEKAVSLTDLLRGKSEEEATDYLTKEVAREVARIMGLAPEELNVNQPVSDIGMDSLTVVELAMKLEEKFGVRVASGTAFAGASIRTIAEKFLATVKSADAASDTASEDLVREMGRQHGVQFTAEEEKALAAAADSHKGN